MNYFLLLVIVGMCGGSYYMYTNDQQQINSLQRQVAELSKANGGSSLSTPPPAVTSIAPSTAPAIAPAAVPQIQPAGAAPAPLPTAAPIATAAPAPAVLPIADHASAIDAAANAAVAASNGTNLGTITTLDHKTYTNCKVLKVEKDGVTFSHDDGITKIMYPMMAPDMQKQFGYTPQGAVADTEAQIRADQQAAAATAGAAPHP